MTVTEHHTRVEWGFRWELAEGQQVELCWMLEREKWIKRFRVRPGGWNDPQNVSGLAEPTSRDDARKIAEKHSEEKP